MLLVGATPLDASQISAGGAELGLGAGRIEIGGLAGLVALAQQRQRVLAQLDRRVEQIAVAIERAQREVRLRVSACSASCTERYRSSAPCSSARAALTLLATRPNRSSS
jgi:hypothetical protein